MNATPVPKYLRHGTRLKASLPSKVSMMLSKMTIPTISITYSTRSISVCINANNVSKQKMNTLRLNFSFKFVCLSAFISVSSSSAAVLGSVPKYCCAVCPSACASSISCKISNNISSVTTSSLPFARKYNKSFS